MKKHLLSLLLVIFSVCATKAQYNLVVAQDGTGNYTTVQAAINAAPTGQTSTYKIYIKKGKYREKISIPSNKPFIYLIGEDVGTVILSWDDYSGKPIPGGGTYGTSNSASVTFNAPDCGAFNITFENTTGDSPQALAINVNADRCAFKNCRFLGGQDTVLTNSSNGNRQYFRNCYIDGTVDFIFGAAIAAFDSCIIYAKTRLDATASSYITAANTPSGQTYGYVFRDCVIPANRGTTSYFMGRPWQNDGTTSPVSNTKVIFLNTTMSSSVKPEGWSVWNTSTNTALITYAEYRSRKFDSSLVDVSQRVSWSTQLTAAQAVTYTNSAMFGTWDPCSALSDICASTPKPLNTANFRGVKGTSTSTFTWNICWPMNTVKYEIFRSSNRVTFSKVAEQTSANDSTVNFTYSEANPPSGSTYYYYVLASKAGFTSHSSDTVAISSTPTITTVGAMGGFLQGLGTPSSAQTYTVSGVNLTNNLVITAPAKFEISNNGGSTWNNSTTPISLTPDVNGNLATTTISVRLNSTTVGTYTDSILHTSTGAASVKVGVSGTTQSGALATYVDLQTWPMNSNNQDSARNSAVIASTPTLNRLFLSNGTTVTFMPAYTTTYGQAFGASAAGDGFWSTANGGPAGNLNRTYYEQFTVTTAPGNSVRVDSFILNSSFYNTASNTRLAVVYSKSGFATDSADVTGGIGADGNSMVSTANGSFANPVALVNETAGTATNYRFALNGSTGVLLTSGQTLTIRLYFSCSSTSAGRYAKVKNVIAKGVILVATPAQFLNVTGSLQQNKAIVQWTTTNEVNTQNYFIERSNDGISFKQLGNVAAKNTAGNHTYSFEDAQPNAGVNYYRIQLKDKDGSTSYSKTVAINTKIKAGLAVYPNPAKNEVVLSHHSSNEGLVQIADAFGKQVITQKLLANATQTTIDISQLPSGTYFVTLKNGGYNTIKFVKQ